MERISAVLFLCMISIFPAAQAQTRKLEDIRPAVCVPEKGKDMRCETAGYNLQSGGGNQWGPWYTLSSTAPNGYKVKSAEAYIEAQNGNTPRHRCGVRDVGTGNPSPISTDGPTKGYRAGKPFWAQCYIAEEDASHVVVKVNIQGEEGAGPFKTDRPTALLANASLYVVYTPK